MDPEPTWDSVIADTLSGFGDTVLSLAPALLGIGLVVFGLRFGWNFAKGLVS